MGLIGFGKPASVLCGGMDYSTEANDLNGGFDRVTPPDASTGVPLPPSTAIPSLAGPNGFLLPGQAAQNIITDPNVVGVSTPGMMTYGPDSLANPLGGSWNGGYTGNYPSVGSGGGDGDNDYDDAKTGM